MADWNKLKKEYIKGGISYRQLAAKYDVSFGTLRNVAAKEGWRDLRDKAMTIADTKIVEAVGDQNARVSNRIYDAADKLLDKLTEAIEMLDAEIVITNMKGFRSLTGALNDLKNIKDFRSDADLREQEARIKKLQKEAKEEDQSENAVEIVISSDVEEYCQ